MDTVWIRLTLTKKSPHVKEPQQEYFMFGPTGIVRFFRTISNETILYRSNDVETARVIEDAEYIMDWLKKIRKTGESDVTKKSSRKRKASSAKTKK